MSSAPYRHRRRRGWIAAALALTAAAIGANALADSSASAADNRPVPDVVLDRATAPRSPWGDRVYE